MRRLWLDLFVWLALAISPGDGLRTPGLLVLLIFAVALNSVTVTIHIRQSVIRHRTSNPA